MKDEDLGDVWARIPSTLALPDDAVIFDVGAHRLQEAYSILPVLPACRWYAFEPDPRSLDILRREVSENPLFQPVTLVESAVGASEGTTLFYQSSGTYPGGDPSVEWTASSSTKAPKEALGEWPWMSFSEPREVPVTTVDNFCQRNSIDHIDLLKIDVQGAEYEVLLGAQHMLRRTHYVITEHSKQELYEGERPLEGQMEALADGWRIRERFLYDAILENTRF